MPEENSPKTQQKVSSGSSSPQNPPEYQTQDVESEKELFSWKSPSTTFKKRDKEFWVKIMVVSGLFGFILFLAEGVMPVILLISIVFLFYVITNIQPEIIVNKITNKGIRIADRLNKWELFTRFWFVERGKNTFLVLETLSIPGRLELAVDSKDKEKLEKVLTRFIPREEIPPTRLDKATEWLSKRFF